MFTRRMILLAGVSASVIGVAKADPGAAKRFLGKWSGYWDGKWPMSLEITSVKGANATVIYTWPDGSSRNSGTIAGNTMKVGPYITLTLSGPDQAVADGDFPTARRTANVTR